VLIVDIIAVHGREGEFNRMSEFCAPYRVTVIERALGVPTVRCPEFNAWADFVLALADHDEDKFGDPDNVDSDCKIDYLLGASDDGARYGLSNHLSRIKAKSTAETAFSRFDLLEPGADEVEWPNSYFWRKPHHLKVRFEARLNRGRSELRYH
jgi:hypothetical protein